MTLPHGVTAPASNAIAQAIAQANARMAAKPRPTKATEFLSANAAESHRIFISTFIWHSTFAHLALGDQLAGRPNPGSTSAEWTQVRVNALESYFGPGVKDFALNYYAATQCLLGGFVGPERDIELFRGIPRETAMLVFSDLARAQIREAFLHVNALSSWSDQEYLPNRFAARSGGAVIRIRLPIEMVFAYWLKDELMEHVLRRQCKQHLDGDPDSLGGEAIVWCPDRCIRITQEDIAADYTQVSPKRHL